MRGGDKPPRRSEKTKECRRCGHRTTHVYDYGLNAFICSVCELGEDNDLKGGRR